MKIFVVFKKQPWEKTNAYSIVDQDTFNDTIPHQIVHAHKEVDDKLLTSEECRKLVDELCK